MRDSYEDSPAATRESGLRRLHRLTWRTTQLGALATVGFAVVFARTAPAPAANVQGVLPTEPATTTTIATPSQAPGQHSAKPRSTASTHPATHPATRPAVQPGVQQTTQGTAPKPTTAPAPAPGTFATMLVADPAAVDAARDLLAAELAAIDAACSRFRPDSELSRACAAGGHPVPVSPLFAEALSVALTAAELTGGDVDPTCGQALAGLGYDRDFALARQEVHAPRRPAVPAGGWREVLLDNGRQEVTVPDGVLLDLGATAKALAADRAAAAIAAATGCGVLVNLGGDIRVAGPPPEGGWLVGVADDVGFDAVMADVEPSQVVLISDGGLATSSTSARAWRRGGV